MAGGAYGCEVNFKKSNIFLSNSAYLEGGATYYEDTPFNQAD